LHAHSLIERWPFLLERLGGRGWALCLVCRCFRFLPELSHLRSHQVFVVASDSYEGEGVADQLGLHVFVEKAGATQRGQAVDFQDPGFELTIENYVEAIYLKAALLAVANFVHLLDHRLLSREQGFYYYIVAGSVDVDVFMVALRFVHPFLLQVLFQKLQTPFR